MRKLISSLVLVVCLFGLSGCQTIKNTGMGLGAVAKGIGDDAYNAWKAVERADKWVEENFW